MSSWGEGTTVHIHMGGSGGGGDSEGGRRERRRDRRRPWGFWKKAGAVTLVLASAGVGYGIIKREAIGEYISEWRGGGKAGGRSCNVSMYSSVILPSKTNPAVPVSGVFKYCYDEESLYVHKNAQGQPDGIGAAAWLEYDDAKLAEVGIYDAAGKLTQAGLTRTQVTGNRGFPNTPFENMLVAVKRGQAAACNNDVTALPNFIRAHAADLDNGQVDAATIQATAANPATLFIIGYDRPEQNSRLVQLYCPTPEQIPATTAAPKT